jgi:hypothetical protein
MPEITISKEYKRLYRVPKHAIIDFLKEKDETIVRKVIYLLDKESTGTIESILIKFELKQLIFIFEKCQATTPQDAIKLYLEYRYRGMKTLHLYSREGKFNLNSMNVSALNRTIRIKTSEFKDPTKKFCNLEIREHESIDKGTIRELSYSYYGFIPYTPPDTEYPSTVTDLRRGFIWIPFHDQWICICSKDDNVAQVLNEALQEYFGFISKPLPLTKTVQQRLENTEDLRKAGYISSSGTIRRLTNPRMMNDSEAMQECRQRDNSDDRPLAGFNINVDGVSLSLSYNESGYIYFSRDLNVDQMREWGVTKIREIIRVINDLKLNAPGALLGEKLSILNGVPKDTKSAIIDIASAIVRCKKERLSDVPLKNDVFVLASKLEGYIKTRFRVYCSKCSDYSEIVCECGSIDFLIEAGHIKCQACNAVVSKVSCFDGHKNNISRTEECIEILPLSRLNDLIAKIFAEATDFNFVISRENFSIRNNRLFYKQDASNTIYRLNEIQHFKQVLTNVPEQEIPIIRRAISQFRERCPSMSNENCSKCISGTDRKKCFLRLFGLYDSHYNPRPHQGHEFGDYSTVINIDNQQKTIVIAMKSDSKKSKVRLRDPVGQDLYSQIGGYLHDGRIDMVGICLPRKLEEGFEAMLKKDAQDKNKKLLIVDDDDLVQITYSVMRNKNMQLDAI